MKHRASSVVTPAAAVAADLDAPTVEFRRPLFGHGRRVRPTAWLAGGSLIVGVTGSAIALTPSAAVTLPASAPVLPAADTMNSSPAGPVSVPAPDGLDLGVVGDIGVTEPDTAGSGTPESNSGTTVGLPVPGGVVGLTTDEAMERYRDAGFRNVRFLNTAGSTVIVPSDLHRVVSAPAAGEVADPDVSLVVWATLIPRVVTPEERAASDRAEEEYDRRRAAERSCGLYTLEGPTSSEVADCIERRTS